MPGGAVRVSPPAEPDGGTVAGGEKAAGELAIAVFARAPEAGRAKTRLIPALGPAGAARLQRRLTLQTLATCRRAGVGEVVLFGAPDGGQRFFRAVRQRCAIRLCKQAGIDLGARMAAAFSAHGGPLLLVGSDCPALQVEHLLAAAAALAGTSSTAQDNAAVFIPAEDGGYVLVGLRSPEPRLFVDIEWGSAGVMAQTRRRLCQLGLPWSELPALWDVDRPADLARLADLPGFADYGASRPGSAARVRCPPVGKDSPG